MPYRQARLSAATRDDGAFRTTLPPFLPSEFLPRDSIRPPMDQAGGMEQNRAR